MFKVTSLNLVGETIELKRTTWAFSGSEGARFETIEAATAALEKARQFMPAKTFRAARVVEAGK